MSAPAPDIKTELTRRLKEALTGSSTFVNLDLPELTSASQEKFNKLMKSVAENISDGVIENAEEMLKSFGPAQTPPPPPPPDATPPQGQDGFTPPTNSGIMDNNTPEAPSEGDPKSPDTPENNETKEKFPEESPAPESEPSENQNEPKDEPAQPSDNSPATEQTAAAKINQTVLEEQRKQQLANEQRQTLAQQRQANQLSIANQGQQQQQEQQAQGQKNNDLQQATKKLKRWKKFSCCMSCLTPASGCLLFPVKFIALIMVQIKKFTVKEIKGRKTASKPSNKK